MREAVFNTLKATVDFILPIVCVHCGVEGSLLCDGCLETALPPSSNACAKCGEPTREFLGLCGDCVALPPPLDRLVPVYQYGGTVRSAVHALKYRGITAIAPLMAREMRANSFFRNAKVDCLAPVPIHGDRLRERGYNQAALLARELGHGLGFLCIEDALIKTRATASQVELSRQERAMSLINAFSANYDFEDAHVLLVDDVCTTGNTLMNCAAALKRAGARRVSAIVFAKEMYESGSESEVP